MKFYTYLYLREDGSPYYVGKGTGNRAFISHRRHRSPQDRTRIKIQRWEDESIAFAFERYLIDFWGRKDLGTGCLHNMTDGGEGRGNPSENVRQVMRANGRVNGRRAVEKGYLARARAAVTPEVKQATGRAQGLKNKESGHARLLGSIQGRRNVESGHIQALGRSGIGGRIGGRIGGQRHVESGHAARLPHLRWHVNRNIINENCPFCTDSARVHGVVNLS